MVSFVQEVFNDISLERDPELWQSEDDGKTLQRIRFLSGFEETRFKQHLETSCSLALAKNSKLCQAFHLKADKTDSLDQKLTLLNKAGFVFGHFFDSVVFRTVIHSSTMSQTIPDIQGYSQIFPLSEGMSF